MLQGHNEVEQVVRNAAFPGPEGHLAYLIVHLFARQRVAFKRLIEEVNMIPKLGRFKVVFWGFPQLRTLTVYEFPVLVGNSTRSPLLQ